MCVCGGGAVKRGNMAADSLPSFLSSSVSLQVAPENRDGLLHHRLLPGIFTSSSFPLFTSTEPQSVTEFVSPAASETESSSWRDVFNDQRKLRGLLMLSIHFLQLCLVHTHT